MAFPVEAEVQESALVSEQAVHFPPDKKYPAKQDVATGA